MISGLHRGVNGQLGSLKYSDHMMQYFPPQVLSRGGYSGSLSLFKGGGEGEGVKRRKGSRGSPVTLPLTGRLQSKVENLE